MRRGDARCGRRAGCWLPSRSHWCQPEAGRLWWLPGARVRRSSPIHGFAPICFPRSRAGAAERRFGRRAIDPSPILRRVDGPALRQVLVLSGAGRARGSTSPGITFVYGVPEPACRSIPRCVGGAPYVIVEELVGLIYPGTVAVTYRAGSVPGPWDAQLGLRCRDLSVDVIGNLPRAKIATIARRLTEKIHCRVRSLR